MTKTRSVLMACGLAGVLGLGALAIGRAQQAEPKGEARGSSRMMLRDRVVTLRTEVDALQLDCDAIRKALDNGLEHVELSDLQGDGVTSEKDRADLRAAIDRKKQEYVRKLRALHEKRLDLEESENRYREVR